MQKIFHKYEDPGHGWLKVKRTDVIHLPITNFSFQRNEYVYLEEDCDMPIFLNDLEKRGVEFKVVYHHTDRKSKIRSYDYFVKLATTLEFDVDFLFKTYKSYGPKVLLDVLNKKIENGNLKQCEVLLIQDKLLAKIKSEKDLC